MTPEKAFKKFIIAEPFYGLFLTTINKVYDDKCPTAGVRLKGLTYELVINLNFWNSLKDEEQLAVLKHETMHIINQHCILYNELSNHDIANIAMDCEINEFIENLPEGGITSAGIKEKYPDFEARQGTRYNYKFLLSKCMEGGGGGSSSSNSCSGSGSGNQGQDQDQSGVGSFKSFDDHSGMQDASKLSDEAKDLLKSQTEGLIKNTARAIMSRNPGNIPGELSELIDELLARKLPVFDWKKYFRRLLGHAEEYLSKSTRKRPSKRFDESAGKKHVHKSFVLVAIDTSGSVNTESLNEFFGELAFIQKAGTSVDVCQFDYSVQDVRPFRKSASYEVYGRGGTSFDAAITYFNEHPKYDHLVIFTDGYDKATLNPRHNKCVWVIDGLQDADPDLFPGKIVYVEHNN